MEDFLFPISPPTLCHLFRGLTLTQLCVGVWRSGHASLKALTRSRDWCESLVGWRDVAVERSPRRHLNGSCRSCAAAGIAVSCGAFSNLQTCLIEFLGIQWKFESSYREEEFFFFV